MKRVILLACLMGGGCTQSPTQPPPVPDCQIHNTGTIVLTNHAANLRPRNALVNGANWGTIPWGGEISRTVSAGIQYVVIFYDSGSGAEVTTPAVVIVPQCGTNGLNTDYHELR